LTCARCANVGTDPAVDALVDVDLVLRRGEWLSITGVLGEIDAVEHPVASPDRPTRGKYLLDGIETTTLDENERAGCAAGASDSSFSHFTSPYRTVLGNVMLAEVCRRHTGRGRRERAMEEIRRVGTSAHRADFPPSKLSGGERSGWRSPGR
jgi:macrolide transport system ATP-binding/permease protein